MRPEATERQIRWLLVLRVVTVTTLLISAFGVELALRPGQTLRPLFLLSAAAYGLVLVYAAADRWLGARPASVFLQLVGDAGLVTGFVAITGGLDSPMSFLYLLPIVVAAMLQYRRGALSLAAVCWTFYAALVLFGQDSGLLRPLPGSSRPADGRAYLFLVVHLVGFVAVALLASYLSERLRAQGRELVERRGAMARLQILNENIIESIHSGLITTDLEGRVQFINRGGTEIVGLTLGDLKDRPIGAVLGLEPDFLRKARAILLARRRFRFEREFERPDGRRIFLGTAVSTLQDRAGAALGYIFIFQDLTEIRALEQEIRLKERMAALGEMAAGMAHELRNPLAAIAGSVHFLRASLHLEGEALELMDIILRESERLDRTIRDFLTFARPGPFAPADCDVVRLLEDSAKLLSRSREFRPAHRVETRFEAGEIRCEVDPNRMKQVFWNLATNALKAMPDGGTLTLEARQLETGHVEIVFADDGVGMDERQRESYFQPFAGAFGGGTGLGAAIVYRLIEEHRGRISLETAPGRGTRIRIVLPRHQQGAPAAAAEALAGGRP